MSTHGLLSQAGNPDWTVSREDPPSPEQELWCAVLVRAFQDACGRPGQIRDSAREYLQGNDEPEELRRVCIWAGVRFDALVERARRMFPCDGEGENETELKRVEEFLADDLPETIPEEDDLKSDEVKPVGLRPVELLDDEEMTGEPILKQ